MCPIHREAKQIEISEFGAEKSLFIVGPCQEKGVGPGGHSPLPQTPQLPEGFQEGPFKGKDWRGASQGM